jgi:hypothetical protein
MTKIQEALVGTGLDQLAMIGDPLIRRADGCVCELKGIPKQDSFGHPTITVAELSTGALKPNCCAAAFDLGLTD